VAHFFIAFIAGALAFIAAFIAFFIAGAGAAGAAAFIAFFMAAMVNRTVQTGKDIEPQSHQNRTSAQMVMDQAKQGNFTRGNATLSATNASDATATDSEVDGFDPLPLNNISVKAANAVVSPPWESTTPSSRDTVVDSNNVTTPPWLHMLNGKKVRSDKIDEDSALASEAEPSSGKNGDEALQRFNLAKGRTHTIRDAIQASANSNQNTKKVKRQNKNLKHGNSVKKIGDHVPSPATKHSDAESHKKTASNHKVSLKRLQKEEKGGQRRHTIKDAIKKAVEGKGRQKRHTIKFPVSIKKASKSTKKNNEVFKASKANQGEAESEVSKTKEEEEESEDDQDEDDDTEDEDDNEDDEDGEDDDDAESEGEDEGEEDEEDDDDSLLQSAPWVGMRSADP